jgi:hypothetical protein
MPGRVVRVAPATDFDRGDYAAAPVFSGAADFGERSYGPDTSGSRLPVGKHHHQTAWGT